MKLTLRDLFWLVLVVAMGCGWWVERKQLLADVKKWSLVKDAWPLEPGDFLSVTIDKRGERVIEYSAK